MSIIRRILFTFFITIVAFQAFSQVTRSPFSTFGIGQVYSSALVNHQGMAGVSVAQPQFWYTATTNPALLVYNNQSMFNAGVIVEQKDIISDTLKERTKGGNLNYLVAAFPILHRKNDIRLSSWTTSMSLMPFTSVRYNVRYEQPISNTTSRAEITEKGSGGISQLSWSNGIRINEQLSVGLKASYFFGSILNTYQNRIVKGNQASAFYAAIDQKYYVKDFGFTAGLSYTLDSLFARKKYRLSIGLVYDLATDLKANRRDIIYRTTSNGTQLEADTLTSVKGQYSIPSGLTLGVALARGNWNVGTEVAMKDWSQFKNFEGNTSSGYGKSMRYAIGGETTPDGFSENLLKRTTYRMGLSYEQTPFVVEQNGSKNAVKDLGVNVGFSVPAGRWSSVDFGFRYGKRGSKSETVFEENYYRIYFGISFNDREWFIRRKFD